MLEAGIRIVRKIPETEKDIYDQICCWLLFSSAVSVFNAFCGFCTELFVRFRAHLFNADTCMCK